MWRNTNIALVVLVAWCCAAQGCKCERSGTEAKPQAAAQAPKQIDAGTIDHDAEPPEPPAGGRKVVVFRNGAGQETTERDAVEKGMTVVDLSNFWVPFIFSERDGQDKERIPNQFRPIFRKLANDWPYESRSMAAAREIVDKQRNNAKAAKIAELRAQGVSEEDIKIRLGLAEGELVKADAGAVAVADTGTEEGAEAGDDEDLSALEGGPGEADNFLEIYGIPPTLSVLKRRAKDELKRECYKDVDFGAMKRFDGFVSYEGNSAAEEEAKKGRSFAVKMREEMERLKLSDPSELLSRPDNKMSSGLMRIALRYEAIVETQKLLACEGLFLKKGDGVKYQKGGIDWKTHIALLSFEHKNRIFGWGFLGKETLAALGRTPEERLFDAFKRVLEERIADAAGVIEDGTARNRDGKKATFRDADGKEREVPNLVEDLTSFALEQMGLTSPEKVVAFLNSREDEDFDRLFAAFAFPKLPPYYSEAMELRAEIDRGDVWYDYPFDDKGGRRSQNRKRMPHLTIFAIWNGQEIPLATMGTTIGGWRSELAPDGYEYYKYKNSDVGPRVWREIYAGPVWLPPETTPVKDLVKPVFYKGRKVIVPNYNEFGPWYASAYGLVAAFHVKPVQRKNGNVDYLDYGIRSHGSFDYNSILRRFSHGCHRFYNHLAIRLFDFVLRHRPFARVGQVPSGFSYKFKVKKGDLEPGTEGEEALEEVEYTIDLGTKGYKYELAEPVPIEVLTGQIVGRQKEPIETYMPKPDVEYGPDAKFLPAGYSPDTDSGADTDSERDTESDSSAPAREKTGR